ncbi:unnamed protein product [Gongylonema pulchrum]|uniref:Mannosyl-oligosaccharide glucosidase n=1 Tax=Gongylonema pulchrum TaxID=637853 RepID=A0A183E3M0_9BILA|nr:unnamed protein product [Gongylonema pulchrum]
MAIKESDLPKDTKTAKGAGASRASPPASGRTKGSGRVNAERPVRTLYGEILSRMNCSRMFIVAALFAALAAVAQFAYYYGVVMPKRISQKCELPTVGFEHDPKIWGTFRSHLYFGLRARHELSPLFGMMWYQQPGVDGQIPRIHHWCEQDNGPSRYAWTVADGRTFGRQSIRDGSMDLFTDWLNDGPIWTARITTKSTTASNYALLFYFALQDEKSKLYAFYKDNELDYFTGESELFGKFSVNFSTSADFASRSFVALKTMEHWDLSQMKELALSATVIDRHRRMLRLQSLYFPEDSVPELEPRLIMLQINVPSNSSTEISFSVDEKEPIKGKKFSEILEQRVEEFNKKFETTYGLSAKGYSDIYLEMGRMALSNMLGSIGYAYGFNVVQSSYSSKPSHYGPHALFSTCPSRSVFPRGFLWDEGFHQLLFRKFDPSLSLEVPSLDTFLLVLLLNCFGLKTRSRQRFTIVWLVGGFTAPDLPEYSLSVVKIIASWLDKMNIDGWIPREMILGREAEQRVPAEFIVQRDSIANPPMLFYLIDKYLDDENHSKQYSDQLKKFYPRLRLWHSWLNATQLGKRAGTYRWRGRNATTDDELNPKTLPSGLDDFPRATHPTDDVSFCKHFSTLLQASHLEPTIRLFLFIYLPGQAAKFVRTSL